MSILSDLRSMLIANGINADDYTDEMLNSFILEAKLLIDEPFMFDTQCEDFDPDFEDSVYMTEQYPVLPNTVQITVGGELITPSKITKDGLIYLSKTCKGELYCSYILGLNGDDINQYLLPIVMYIIKDNLGQNLSSINEGDISVSYDTTSSINTQITNLIRALKDKYNSRVVFI